MSPWIMLPLDAAVAVFIIRHVVRARNSRSWPTVQATVTHSDVARNGKEFKPRVEYAYTVDGQHYKSRRLQVGATVSTDERRARKAAAAFPVGQAVSASVNPRDPSYAVLMPGWRPLHAVLLTVATLLVVIPFAVALLRLLR